MSKEDAIFYLGQEIEGMIYRAMEAGVDFDDILAEVRFKLDEVAENRDDYENAA